MLIMVWKEIVVLGFKNVKIYKNCWIKGYLLSKNEYLFCLFIFLNNWKFKYRWY